MYIFFRPLVTSGRLQYGHTFSGLEAYSILRKPFFAENLPQRYSVFENFQTMPDFWPDDVYRGNRPHWVRIRPSKWPTGIWKTTTTPLKFRTTALEPIMFMSTIKNSGNLPIKSNQKLMNLLIRRNYNESYTLWKYLFKKLIQTIFEFRN